MKFYRFNLLHEDTAEIYIYGAIFAETFFDEDVSALSFIKELNEHQKAGVTKLIVRINSPGGDVGQAFAIYNALVNFEGTVTTQNDGQAFSAASLIFMAGSTRRAAELSTFLFHNPRTFASGTSDDFKKVAEDLETLAEMIVTVYAEVSGMERSELDALLDEDRVLSSNEAMDLGFVDEIQPAIKAVALSTFDARSFESVKSLLMPKPRLEKDFDGKPVVHNRQLPIAVTTHTGASQMLTEEMKAAITESVTAAVAAALPSAQPDDESPAGPELLGELESAFPDNPGFAIEQFKKGATLAFASVEYVAVLRAERDQARAETEEARTSLAEMQAATQGTGTVPLASQQGEQEYDPMLNNPYHLYNHVASHLVQHSGEKNPYMAVREHFPQVAAALNAHQSGVPAQQALNGIDIADLAKLPK